MLSEVVFILLINVKMPTIVGILTFISIINYNLGSWFYCVFFMSVSVWQQFRWVALLNDFVLYDSLDSE